MHLSVRGHGFLAGRMDDKHFPNGLIGVNIARGFFPTIEFEFRFDSLYAKGDGMKMGEAVVVFIPVGVSNQ